MVTCGWIVEIVKIVDVSPVMFLFTPVVDLIKIADLAIFARIILLRLSYLIMASSSSKPLMLS